MRLFLAFIILICVCTPGFSQKKDRRNSGSDSLAVKEVFIVRDSSFIADSLKRAHIRKVTRRSAFVPGWGQVTNKQSYKVPVIYGGLGFITYLFFENLGTYRELRDTYILMTDTIPGNDDLIPEKFRPLSANSVKFYRDQFRRNVDFSALAFIILWGLNVVDATVFAHLKEFDVSDDLSMRIKMPQYNMASGQGQVGIAIQLKPPSKTLKPLPAR